MKRLITFLLLFGSVSLAQVPAIVQYISSGRDDTIPGTGPPFKAVFPNPTLSGNCLLVSFEHDSSITVSTVTTDKSDTLTAGPSVTNSGQVLTTYFGTATVGSQIITVTTTGTPVATVASFRAVEINNSNCTSDVQGTSATRSVTVTTTVANDFIFQNGVDVTTNTPTITSMASSGCTSSCTILAGNRNGGMFAQYEIPGTSGAKTIGFTTSDADTWESTVIAVKAAATGTPRPSTGLRIISLQGEAFGTTTHTMQVPSSGNMLVAVWSSAQVTISSASSSPANTWNTPAGAIASASGEFGQVFWACAASTSNTLTLSPTYSGTDTQGFNFLIVADVAGAATACHDTDVTLNSGNQTTNGTLTTPSITPSTANGLIFNTTVWVACTVTSVTPGIYAGAALDNGNSNGFAGTGCPTGTSASTLNEDDGRALYYNPNTSSVAFVYSKSNSNGAVGTYVSVSSAFKGPPEAPNMPPVIF